MEVTAKHLRISRRKSTITSQICAKDERNASFRKITAILQKPDDIRTTEEVEILLSYADVVQEVKQRLERRLIVKQRVLEIEDPKDEFVMKCKILAKCIKNSQHLVIYTGAGISTAARIPDYRGTNGIWTRLQQGKDIGTHDLSLADPTYTHMALSTLYHRGILKYVVSQNCDGLHLRSGLPRTALSELHGNMAIEVCKHCKPSREYWRLFDVTENTARYSHKTMRRCYHCNNALVDTIVHFGERGTLQWPLNWSGACKNADEADVILCLGSSLKVLKKYPWLWQMDKPVKKRPNLYIVNLQWTPKDDAATMKINGKCDAVMDIVMSELGINVTEYTRANDPIFYHASVTADCEIHTKTQPELRKGDNDVKEEEQEGEERIKTEDEIKKEVIEESEEASDEQVMDLSIKKMENHTDIACTKIIDDNVKKKSPVKESVFAIDNLLAKNVHESARKQLDFELKTENSINFSPNVSSPSYFTPLTLNPFHTFVTSCYTNLQNSFSLLSPPWYPYQTSFLYPGFHSIINPIPFFNYDFQEIRNATSGITSTDGERTLQIVVEDKPKVPTCSFCHKHYESLTCLFYLKYDAIFQKPIRRFSKTSNENKHVYCECCDYTSESEEENCENFKKIKNNDPNNSDIQIEHELTRSPKEVISENQTSNDILTTVNNKIQPGWFGKGYRKKKTRKR